MSEQEVLIYPRFIQGPLGGRVDRSSVIARFKVGQEFVDRTSEDRSRYRITRIERDGMWGVPAEPEEEQPA